MLPLLRKSEHAVFWLLLCSVSVSADVSHTLFLDSVTHEYRSEQQASNVRFFETTPSSFSGNFSGATEATFYLVAPPGKIFSLAAWPDGAQFDNGIFSINTPQGSSTYSAPYTNTTAISVSVVGQTSGDALGVSIPSQIRNLASDNDTKLHFDGNVDLSTTGAAHFKGIKITPEFSSVGLNLSDQSLQAAEYRKLEFSIQLGADEDPGQWLSLAAAPLRVCPETGVSGSSVYTACGLTIDASNYYANMYPSPSSGAILAVLQGSNFYSVETFANVGAQLGQVSTYVLDMGAGYTDNCSETIYPGAYSPPAGLSGHVYCAGWTTREGYRLWMRATYDGTSFSEPLVLTDHPTLGTPWPTSNEPSDAVLWFLINSGGPIDDSE